MDHTEHPPRVAGSLFERAYADYLKSVRQVWSDYLADCEESCVSYLSTLERFTTDSGHQHREAERDYHAALLGDSGVREEMSEAAYRHYMHAILMLWDFERALQESQCAQKDYCKALMNCADAVSIERAQSAYVQQLKVAWTPEIAANCVDSYNEHVQILANAWTMAQRSVQPAHRDYLQAVQKAWARIDTSEIDHDCLAEIAKYMTAVAQHPIFGAVRWHSSAPTFHRVAGEEL